MGIFAILLLNLIVGILIGYKQGKRTGWIECEDLVNEWQASEYCMEWGFGDYLYEREANPEVRKPADDSHYLDMEDPND